MTIFYFTATGNSLYVAKKIGGNLLSIPQLMREEKLEFEDDVIGFVYPCFGLGLPKIVHKFIERVKIKAKYVFAVTTFGNVAGAALRIMEKLAGAHGISFDYMNQIKMVDNYLPGYKVEYQISSSAKKQIEENIIKVVGDVKKRVKFKPSVGVFSKIVTSLGQSMFAGRLSGMGDNEFRVNSLCTKCGMCARVCPVANISVEDEVYYLHHCEFCMACIHMCPENAIHVRGEKSDVRFRNRGVMVKEIVEANEQKQP